MMRAFVQRMPKGGDLHSHLSGAVYAESYLEWAAEGNFCVDLAAQRLVPPPCKESAQKPLAKNLLQKNEERESLINKLSTRNLDFAGQSGHDQFFAAFGGFGAVSNPYEHGVEMLTEVANRAASQHIQYRSSVAERYHNFTQTVWARALASGLRTALRCIVSTTGDYWRWMTHQHRRMPLTLCYR